MVGRFRDGTDAGVFPGGLRLSDYFGFGVIAQVFPLRSVEAAPDACGMRGEPLEAMECYVIAMDLFRQVSIREVLCCLADGLRWAAPGVPVRIPGKSSISRARSWLGTVPFEDGSWITTFPNAPAKPVGWRRRCPTPAGFRPKNSPRSTTSGGRSRMSATRPRPIAGTRGRAAEQDPGAGPPRNRRADACTLRLEAADQPGRPERPSD